MGVLPQSQTTSEKPRESPTTATVTVRPSIYQAGIASIWLLATVEGAETHHIYMQKTCYEFEVGEIPQS